MDIVMDVLSILGIATKKVKRGLMGELIPSWLTIVDKNYIQRGTEEVNRKHRHRQRFGQLEEAKMAAAEHPKVGTPSREVTGVKDVEREVQSVSKKVEFLKTSTAGCKVLMTRF